MVFDLLLRSADLCSMVSRMHNHEPGLKVLIRAEELEVFEFWLQATMLQHNDCRHYFYEQPRSSELLLQPEALKHKDKTDATDQTTCMCMHDLKDPESGKPYMKQTTLRGTARLRKSIIWCSGDHQNK